MSGFNIIVSFLFASVLISGTIYYTVSETSSSVMNQLDTLQTTSQIVAEQKSSFDLVNPYYLSGRLKFFLENTGKKDLKIIQEDENCFEVFVNNKFILKDDFNYYFSNPRSVYSIVDQNEVALLDIHSPSINLGDDILVEVESCEGNHKSFKILTIDRNWWDSDYEKRMILSINHSEITEIENYLVELDFNESSFDFAINEPDALKFVMDISEQYNVLDLTFDIYSQYIKDYSRYDLNATLGLSSGVETSDPSIERGLFFDALNFDGIDDEIRILSSQSLEIKNQMSLSAWVKWNGSGDSTQYLFVNGGSSNSLSIINDGGVDDDKISFALRVDGINYELISNTQLDSDWHLITAIYNLTHLVLYIDGVEDSNFETLGGPIDTFASDNYIGSEGGINFYNGTLDDIRLMSIYLTSAEIQKLYEDKPLFREIPYEVTNWDKVAALGEVSILLPVVRPNDRLNVSLYLPYDDQLGILFNVSTLQQNNEDLKIIFTSPTPLQYANTSNNWFFVNATVGNEYGDYSVFTDLDQDNVLWLSFEDENSSLIIDISSYGKNGTFEANAFKSELTYGVIRGKYLALDGTGDRVVIPYGSELDLTTSGSVFFWVEFDAIPASGSTFSLISKENGGGQDAYGVEFYYNNPLLGADEFVFRSSINNGGVQMDYDLGSTPLNQGWYHVGLVWNSSSSNLYINGVSQANSGGVTASYSGNADLYLGHGPVLQNNYLNGKLDDIILFSRSLTADEVLSIYAAQDNPYEHNFTGLSQGTYQYNSCGIDMVGRYGCTGSREITLT